jgi:predicted transcriptional regulator/Flp pilus assembly pilin Flp
MRKWRSLLGQESGSALIEFAILAGLIVLVAFGSIQFIGNESEHTFASLATKALRQPGSAVQSSTDIDIQGDSSHEDSEKNRGLKITIDQNILLAVIGCLGIVVWQSYHRRRLRRIRELAAQEADRQLIERLDSKRFAKRQEILKVLEADPTALVQGRVEVRHLMTTGLSTVNHKASLKEMKMIMAEQHVRHFPVVKNDGTLLGIVSDRDLLDPTARIAADVMTRKLITVTPTTKINSALFEIINRNISCLPVMEGTKLAGILTTTDLMMTLQCAFQLWQRQEQVTKSTILTEESRLNESLIP